MLATFFVKYFGGRAAKAVVAGVTGTLSMVFGPEVFRMIQMGVVEGFGPAAHQIGVFIGAALGTGIIFLLNHIPTYWKRNIPNPKIDG